MTSDVTYNSNIQIIEITHTGVLTKQGIETSTSEGLALHKELGVDAVLIDTLNLESVESLIDLYDLPKQYDEGGARRTVHIALVMPATSAARDAMQFYENVCVNRGWVVLPFERHDEATEWLLANKCA